MVSDPRYRGSTTRAGTDHVPVQDRSRTIHAASREAMRPPPFVYECPSAVAEAVTLLPVHASHAQPLAGA